VSSYEQQWIALMTYLPILLLVALCLWPVISYANNTPPLTLSKLYQANENLQHYWVSEKYDGVRAYWDGKKLYTRSGRQIQAPADWIEHLPKAPLDGELWITHGAFNKISGLIRKRQPDPAQWRTVKFMAFDLPDHPGTFVDRYHALQQLINHSKNPHLRLVRQTPIASHSDLQRHLNDITAQGAEGLMLRRINSRYTKGRSQDLLKVKPYMDDEAVVINHQQGQGKYINQLGALIVMDKKGREFKIGTGFSDEERAHPPAVGETITYRYHGHTATGLPRFASFLRVKQRE
jgi:DNA ligase-1